MLHNLHSTQNVLFSVERFTIQRPDRDIDSECAVKKYLLSVTFYHTEKSILEIYCISKHGKLLRT